MDKSANDLQKHNQKRELAELAWPGIELGTGRNPCRSGGQGKGSKGCLIVAAIDESVNVI